MKKALVIYASRTNETKKIAQLIAEGMKAEGIDVMTFKVSEVNTKQIHLANCECIILGSPTYKRAMLPEMKAFLGTLEKAGLEIRVGGAFGAFGWSGEASKQIYEIMVNRLKIKSVKKPLTVKSTSETGWTIEARKYGRELANMLKYGSKISEIMH